MTKEQAGALLRQLLRQASMNWDTHMAAEEAIKTLEDLSVVKETNAKENKASAEKSA